MLRLLKILVSVGLLGYLVYAVDWLSALPELWSAEPLALLGALMILVLQLLVSAWKWQISLSIHTLEWKTGKLLRIILVAMFFNNFLPTAVGGDIYRAYRTLPASGRKSTAVSALLLERIVGLLSLFFVSAIGAAIIYVRDGDKSMALLIVVFSVPLIIAAMLPSILRLAWFQPSLKKLAQIPKLDVLAHNAKLILGRRQRFIHLLGASLLFQIMAILAIVLLFSAVGTFGIVAESAVVGAMYALASLLPVSINGLGVMEGSFAFTAQTLGIGFDSAVVVSLMLRVFVIFVSLVGAIVFLLDKGRAADIAAAATSLAEIRPTD